MRRIAVIVFLAVSTPAFAQTTIDNDDSCDLSLLPAATLLLPYFEVDLSDTTNPKTTLVTIQNTSAQPQIARVTLRTDWAVPVLTFNVFLTGYGVASINVRDVLRGAIAPGSVSPGALSNSANPHFLPDAGSSCANLPSKIPDAQALFVRTALTGGNVTLPGCAAGQIGGVHANAIGYATIDVVANCDTLSAENDDYFTRELLFDNVLTGDYQHVDANPATGNYASGNPLVHIRAIPEGGVAGENRATNLPFTFYDLYTTAAPARTFDRRQPLPNAFTPRVIEGGTGAFNTNYLIWREPSAKPANCPRTFEPNASLNWPDQLRFDEHENSFMPGGGSIILLPPGAQSTPAALLLPSTSSYFPSSNSSDLGGWMYVDLNNGGSKNYSATRKQSQGWMVTRMFAEGRYSVEMDAAAIGNGCSPAPVSWTKAPIGPAPNPNAALPGSPSTTNNDDSCDISVLPAATLLLPYFEVDYKSPATTARTTVFTIQNVSQLPQIARVTIWTDWSYPMLTFNLFLTGYDVQGINLYDIFNRGVVAPGPNVRTGGTSYTSPPGDRSQKNDANTDFLPDAATTCANMPGPLDTSLVFALQQVFGSKGLLTTPGCATAQVASAQANAIGYVTVDLVANCDSINPTSPNYVAHELLFDNVLTGDYQDINPNPATGNYAGGNPLVHIRAIPEGGPAGQSVGTNLPYTFYDRYTASAPARTFDRRQPLPSAFMPRFIDGGAGAFTTNLKIWREGVTPAESCGTNYVQTSAMNVAEIVRFDEHENPTFLPGGGVCPQCTLPLPAASAPATVSALFPQRSGSGDLGGWLYLNLNNGGAATYSAARNYRGGSTWAGARQSQSWVVTSMKAEGRYSVDMDALPVGNGCSPAPPLSSEAPIGPARNLNPKH